MKKVTFKEQPELFGNITEFSIDSIREHRKGSNFYREDIIEFKPEHKVHFKDLENFEDYIGTWRTNNVIWDEDYGWDEEFSELNKVKKIELITYTWENE